MSKDQKDYAERQHRFAHRLLQKALPDCEVTYNGDVGVDHKIIYNDRTTFVETKTCCMIVGAGIDKEKMKKDDRPIIWQKHRIGILRFDRSIAYPYEPLSQHDWLVASKGWYLFVIGSGKGERGRKMVSGAPAWEISLSEKPVVKRMSWAVALNQCRPDWLDRLKAQVYNTGVPKQQKIGLKGPTREMHDVWFKKCDRKACPIVEHMLEGK